MPMRRVIWPRAAASLILERHANDVAALELLAGGFRLILVKPGKTRAVERLVAFLYTLGERFGRRKNSLGLELSLDQVLPGLVFPFEGADLDQPAAARSGMRRRLCLGRATISSPSVRRPKPPPENRHSLAPHQVAWGRHCWN